MQPLKADRRPMCLSGGLGGTKRGNYSRLLCPSRGLGAVMACKGAFVAWQRALWANRTQVALQGGLMAWHRTSGDLKK